MRPPTLQQVNDRFAKAWPALASLKGTDFNQESVFLFIRIMVQACHPNIKTLKRTQIAALEESCRHLEGKHVSEYMLKCNTYRIIANWNFIMDSMPIPEWNGSQETSDCVFIGVYRLPCEQGELPKYAVKIKLKTGLCAGIITWVFLNENSIYSFLEHTAGVRDYNCAAEEIAGMEAKVVVEVVGAIFHVRQWSCSQANKKHNKQLAEARSDVRKCKKNIPCNTCKCTIYTCPLAVWIPKE